MTKDTATALLAACRKLHAEVQNKEHERPNTEGFCMLRAALEQWHPGATD